MLPNLTAYKIDIQQGNYISQDMVAKLKPGMTRSQVRFILGTPLVADPFHADRWDYIYRFSQRGRLKEERHITVVFEQDKLARIEGDVVPAEAKEGAAVPDGKKEGAVPATAGGKESSAPSAAPKEGSAGAANAAAGSDGAAAGQAPRSEIGKQ